MRATASLSPARKDKQRLLTSCAIAAGIAALAYGGPALAQVAGTGSFASGTGSINSNAGTNTTTVNVDGAQTIINWIPTDAAATGGAIDFLPVGENWNFGGSGDYTVLNRFVNGGGGTLSRQIALNGTVNSTDFFTSGGRGGNIWFYNAGGILIGATGVINVGSLVLTTNDIITTGGLFGPGGTIRFNGAAGSTSAITVNGAINANKTFNAGNSYVALVAPRVVQAGTVRVDGSVAYVAAEQAEIRINGGLFDINVTTGAEGGNAITHTGTTTGPAHQQGDTDQSRIFMVAIPKNDAVTMLVSGQIGYDDALSAQVDPDGAVRLSAGYNITAGELSAAPVNATAANITVNDTLFRSNTIAHASGAFVGQALQETSPSSLLPNQGRVFVEGNATFIGDASATLIVGAGQSVGATGDFILQSGGIGTERGNSSLAINGGQFSVDGNLVVSALGALNATTGNAQGGIATFTQTGGDVVVGDMTISADAIGDVAQTVSGVGTGGTATIDLLGGTISAGAIAANANGQGGQGSEGSDDGTIVPGGLGGNGQGGTATINIEGSAVVTAGSILANAAGVGGAGGDFFNQFSFSGNPGPPGNGGVGTGGNAVVNVTGGTTSASTVIADASGIGGAGGNSFFSSSSGGATGVGVGGTGGVGRGGTATIDLSTPIPAVGLARSLARGIGGIGGDHNVGGNGGDGFGGLAQMIVNDFNVGTLAVVLDSSATGGSGANGRDGRGGNGGNASGGVARFQLEGSNARIAASATNFRTDGEGGEGGNGALGFGSGGTAGPAGGNGGDGTGGTVEVIVNGGTAAIVPSGIFDVGAPPPASLGSGGIGGAGGNGAGSSLSGGSGGNGGNGSGGTVHLVANGGTITTNGGALDIVAFGEAGVGGSGGDSSSGAAAAGTAGQTGGGFVQIESRAADTPSQINFGVTRIAANGDTAGRIELRTSSSIVMTSLEAQALGTALPTNNDTDVAPAGIFLAATGGTISTTGDMLFTTDSSFGTYAQSNGTVSAGGNLTITATDQIDIRHGLHEGTTPTIQATGNFTATAGSISGASGSLLGAGATLSLTTTSAGLDIDRLDATDIVLNVAGAASVEHAEADNDFTATAGSFRTGLNSIITGGDIVVTSPGAVDLGNSTAGGFVQVTGQSIAFNNIDAGLTVGLSAGGTVAGAEGIRGGSITAGEDINLFANSIALTGTVTGNASFFAFGTGGPVSVNEADVDGTISIFSATELTGTYVAGGDIFLNSNGNIAASAQANGGYVDGNGNTTQGNLFVIAAGNAALTDSGAGRMLGVNAGGAASIDGGTAGEDILVIAGTTANLTDVTGGDDITVRAVGSIDALNVRTTGTGADTHILDFSAVSGSPTFTIGMGEGTNGTNGADIVMASTTGAIDAVTLSAGDDILLNAANSIGINGATTLGLGTTGGDSSIRTQGGATTLARLDSFSDVIVDAAGIANLTGPVAAGRDATINAVGVTLATLNEPGGNPVDTLSAGGNIFVNASAGIAGGDVAAGGNAALTAGTTIAVRNVSGVDVALDGAAGIAAELVSAAGTTSLDSAGGNVLLGSLVSTGQIAASANAIRIESGGNMHFVTLTTDVGDAYVRAGGDFSVASGNVAGTADLRTQGEAMTIGNLTAANAIIGNTNGFLNLDTITVAGSLDASARTSLGVNGVVTGQSIALASASIAIAPTGRVGTAGVTQQLSVANNNADNQTFIGGTGTRSGYHLDADELTRLYGNRIEIFAPEVQAAGATSVGSAAQPDVIVDSFTVTGGAAGSNLGANGSLTIETPGKMRVIGNVQLTGLSDTNALNLIADDALEVILGQGTVRLLGTGSAPGGQLNMESADIIVATEAAITAVGAATGIDAINARLGENDGVILDEGALFARGIRADVVGGFYVQNSGAGTDFGQRRGLTFGAGGLEVRTQGPSRIAINGVQLGANGQVTGLDVIPSLIIGAQPNGVPGTFDPRSTFNGCFIANPAACTTVTFDFENSFPVQDVIEEEIDNDDDGDGDGNNLPQPLITVRELDALTGEPLLDDPVTGAGNDDLWTAPTEQP